MKPAPRYRTPPKRAFREMGLGQLVDGRCKVVAGFHYQWWDPELQVTPLTVNARVLRVKTVKA